MLPAIKKFFREFDIFKSNVEELNKSVIRVEAQTKSTSDKVDLISKMTAENITEMKTIILMMNEAVAELGKTVNEILHEHYANHPKEKEHEEHHHRKKPP